MCVGKHSYVDGHCLLLTITPVVESMMVPGVDHQHALLTKKENVGRGLGADQNM